MKTTLEQTTPALSLAARITISVQLLLVAAFIGLLADLPHLPLMLLGGLVLLFTRRRPLPVSDRTVTYSLLVAIIVGTMLAYLFPYERGRLGFFSFFFRPEYYCAFALNIAIASCLFPYPSLACGMTLTAVVFILGTCGDVVQFNHVNTRWLWGNDWINSNYRLAFNCLTGIELALSLLLLKLTRQRQSNESGRNLCRWAQAGSLVLLAAAIWGVLTLHKKFEREIRDFEHSLMAMGRHSLIRQLQPRIRPFFADEVDLNLPFWFDGGKQDRRVLLRVIGETAPGYLRARCFNNYEQGRWNNLQEAMPVPLQVTEQEGLLALSQYRREDCLEFPLAQWDIYYAGGFYSPQLPVPSPLAGIDLAAESLSMGQDGQLKPEKWKREAGYRAYTPRQRNTQSAFDLPQEESLVAEQYLTLDAEIRPALAQFCQNIDGWEEATSDYQRLQLLVEYLQENFVYRLGPFKDEQPRLSQTASPSLRRRLRRAYKEAASARPQGRRQLDVTAAGDPVLHFLQNTRAGHCELFASAAVLLLRQNGIPARYVTGFICWERHPSGSYFVARQGHAHAWVEAYDRQSQRWLSLDPTPPAGLRQYDQQWTALTAFFDRLQHLWNKGLADVQRGFMAMAVVWSLQFMWRMFWNPVGVSVALLLVYLQYRYWRRQRRPELLPLTPQQRRLAKNYAAFARRWEKRLHLPPQPERTARELLELASGSGKLQPEELRQMEEYITEYELQRFGQG